MTLTSENLAELETEMRRLMKEGHDMVGKKITPREAKVLFKDQPLKLELIDDLVKEKKPLTVYSLLPRASASGERVSAFTDLCRGGHVKNTEEINPDAFKLTKIAGAYWQGDEKNKQLQRIYGVAFETKEELEKYLATLEEAEKRDHKKLGRELDLFVFSDLVGSGLPLFTPKGTVIREALESFVQSLQEPAGYERVWISHITKKDLYKTSGHLEKFKKELFEVATREGHKFLMKPMNCPHHTQIYASRKRSYRELPIRYSEVTTVYRDEQSGELSGLARVRAITQDDAHVFCRIGQVQEEALKVWDIVDTFYTTFNMPLTVRFSRHDPKQMKKYLGTPATWKKAESELLSLIKKRGATYSDGLGEAALYGPKIDFIAKDSLGREWQLATIQLDFNQPERFDLTCVNEEGKEERVVMIHRAILGSVERFMAVLIEHYAGAFPLWLAPVQVGIIPVSEKLNSYAADLEKKLKEHSMRVVVKSANDTLGKRIREAELEKIPYLLIVGEREEKNKSVSVRHPLPFKERMGDRYKEGEVSIEELLSRLTKESKEKSS